LAAWGYNVKPEDYLGISGYNAFIYIAGKNCQCNYKLYIIGWLLFSVILGMMKPDTGAHGFIYTLGLTILYSVAMLTAGRIIINKSLREGRSCYW
jgi:hypothetical protein